MTRVRRLKPSHGVAVTCHDGLIVTIVLLRSVASSRYSILYHQTAELGTGCVHRQTGCEYARTERTCDRQGLSAVCWDVLWEHCRFVMATQFKCHAPVVSVLKYSAPILSCFSCLESPLEVDWERGLPFLRAQPCFTRSDCPYSLSQGREKKWRIGDAIFSTWRHIPDSNSSFGWVRDTLPGTVVLSVVHIQIVATRANETRIISRLSGMVRGCFQPRRAGPVEAASSDRGLEADPTPPPPPVISRTICRSQTSEAAFEMSRNTPEA